MLVRYARGYSPSEQRHEYSNFHGEGGEIGGGILGRRKRTLLHTVVLILRLSLTTP